MDASPGMPYRHSRGREGGREPDTPNCRRGHTRSRARPSRSATGHLKAGPRERESVPRRVKRIPGRLRPGAKPIQFSLFLECNAIGCQRPQNTAGLAANQSGCPIPMLPKCARKTENATARKNSKSRMLATTVLRSRVRLDLHSCSRRRTPIWPPTCRRGRVN